MSASRSSNNLIGEVGGNFIREALSRSEPKRAIQDFQNNNDINDELCKPILPLLDLHGLTRAEVFGSLLEILKAELVKKVDTLDEKGLDLLLDQTFPYISFPELEEIPMAILKRHPNVPPQYLQKLAATPNLYQNCPIEVKRQIWQVNTTLFKESVNPLIDDYIKDEDVIFHSQEMLNVNRVIPKKRREHKIIQQLVHFIGRSAKLYSYVLHFVRTLFSKTGNLNLCTLRAEILMALHDQEVNEVVELDGCHKFAWCLDACIRSNSMELRRIKEIASYFDSLTSESNTLGDVGMVIYDPYATHMLVGNIYNCLLGIIEKKGYPKDDESVRWMTQLVTLGLAAKQMIAESKFKIPKVEKELNSDFYSLMCCILIEDKMRDNSSPNLEPYDAEIKEIIEQFPLAKLVFFHHVLNRVVAGDLLGMNQAFQFLLELKPSISEERGLFQSLVSCLSSAQEIPGEYVNLRKQIIFEMLVPAAQKASSETSSSSSSSSSSYIPVTCSPSSPLIPSLSGFNSSCYYILSQIIRLLIESHIKLPISLAIESSQKIIDIITNVPDSADTKKIAENLQKMLKSFPKITPKNGNFIYEFIDKHVPKLVDKEGSKENLTEKTSSLSSLNLSRGPSSSPPPPPHIKSQPVSSSSNPRENSPSPIPLNEQNRSPAGGD